VPYKMVRCNILSRKYWIQSGIWDISVVLFSKDKILSRFSRSRWHIHTVTKWTCAIFKRLCQIFIKVNLTKLNVSMLFCLIFSFSSLFNIICGKTALVATSLIWTILTYVVKIISLIIKWFYIIRYLLKKY